MTDKQIIIDGVDVSECEYRDWRNFCRCDNSKENEGEERITGRGGCKYNPNCYYKQLVRKEQECEELKRQHQGDKGLITATGKQNYKLMQEYDKLKTTLAEIKEIAEVLAQMTDEYENCYDRDRCFECDFTEDCQYFNIKRIIQKISEVENEKT